MINFKKEDYINLSKKYGTPFYLIDKDEAKKRVNEIKSRFPKNSKLCFAIKSNAFLTEILKDEDILFEVCSPGELSICEKAGLNPEKIVFSGVCKTFEDVKRAYNLKVHTITLESKAHCEYLIKAANEAGEKSHKQNAILRLSSKNQFGMSENDIFDCIEELKKVSSINIRGIHYFSGTQKRFKDIQEEIPFVESFCEKLNEKYSLDLDIEYGAGLPYEYFSQNDESTNFSALEDFTKLIENSKFSYVIELGRYVASPCAVYVTKIMDVKGDDKNTYCIIDGGINHINYYGQMMGMRIPKIEQIKECDGNGSTAGNNSEASEQTVCATIAGSLCTTADIVLRQLNLDSPKIGDLLVFKDIGAYSITEGIYLFLSHPLPSVLCADGESSDSKTISVLRKSEETYILNS